MSWLDSVRDAARTAQGRELPAKARRALLDLAADLLQARGQRVRGITPQRILEGLVVRHLGGLSDHVSAVVAGR